MEMQQNSGRTQWPFAETDAKLPQIMVDIHANTVATAEEYGVPADYVGGDTASFRPLKLDEEEADEDVFEEQQDTNH